MAVPANFGDRAAIPGLVANWIHTTGKPQDPEVTLEYLTEAISEITLETQTMGSALLQVTLIDPAWKVARSGICDTDEDGLLQPVDVRYPEGTDVWWRLAMVDVSDDLADPNLTLTFQQRIVSYLTQCWGPLAVAPNTTTRAQFIKQLADKMPKELPKKLVGPGGVPKITFICPELNDVQPIATSNSSNTVVIPGTQASSTNAHINKAGGLGSGSGLTAAGHPLSATQTSVANRLLAVCRQLNAGQVATEAMIYAAIYESDLGANPSTNSLGYTGVLQGNVRYGFSPASVEDEARSFLQGGKGFNSAITLSHHISNPIEVAVRCEVPSIWPDNAYAHESGYSGDAAALAEVRRIVQAGGGGGLGGGGGSTPTTSDVSQLTRGNSENPDEDSWTCMQRLASEVNWSLFTSPSPSNGIYGNYLYYMDGPTLVAQKPSVYVSLSDDGTTWSAKDPDTGKTLDGGGDGMITKLHSTLDNCLALDTPIPTPTGWTTMRDLQPGDCVFGSDGRPTDVIEVPPVHHGRECFRVEFNDGSHIISDGGHLWETITARRDDETIEEVSHQRYRGVRSTDQIRRTLQTPDGFVNHRVRLARSLDLPAADLPIDPYVFGYWLGDGHACGPTLSVGGEDLAHVLSELERAGYSHRVWDDSTTGFGRRPAWRVGFSLQSVYRRSHCNEDNLTRRLRELGTQGAKHIPALYLRASESQRLALLQGLMDSDGSFSKYCCFCVADERLARDVRELLRTLAFRPNWVERPPRGTSKRQYCLNFAPQDDVEAFRLPRKARTYASRLAERKFSKSQMRTIRNVVPVESVPVKCIWVAAEDHLFLAGEALVPTHNTAFQYQQTRKVKGKTQRKTRIQTPQTPSKIMFNMLSGVMQFNAGDVVVFQNAGPLSSSNGGTSGNGRWIIEDATQNSLQDLFAQFTLGPPTYPYPEPAANTSTVLGPNGQPVLISQGGNSAGGAGGQSGGKPTGTYKGLSSPFTHWMGNITLRNVDQGVDFGMGYSNIHVGDEILAIGDCFRRASSSTWLGQPTMWFEFTQALKASTGYWGWYCNEEVSGKVGVSNQLIPAGTIIGTYASSGTGIEIGWAAGPGTTWCQAHFPGEVAGRHNGNGTTPGRDFLNFLQQVGAAGPNPKHNAGPSPKPFAADLGSDIPVTPDGIFQSIFDRS